MLTDRQDAFGHLIYDAWVGLDSYEVDERDDGFVGVAKMVDFYLAPFEKWPAHQQTAMEFARGRVLDVGAGGGRHSLYLQQRGHAVVTLDNSPLAVRTCRERGLADTLLMPVTQVSSRVGTFDTILMLGNNFGLFGSFRRARWLLRRFLSLTSPDARIIAESRDPHQTDCQVHLAYQALNRSRGRMPGQLRLRIRYLTYCTPWFDYLLVSKTEMESILAGTGWQVERYLDAAGGSYIAVITRATGRA